jgi:hypothetical protein
VLDPGEGRHDRAVHCLPRARQNGNVARRALENEVDVFAWATTLEEDRRRGDEDEIDLVLASEPHGVVPRLGGSVRGDAGRHAALDETAASIGELRRCTCEVAVVAQEASENELARRPPSERLGDCEQVVERGRVACDDHDRALPRRQRICLRGQLRALLEDRLLELVEGRARLDAQLVPQQTPRLAIDLQPVCLASGAVERQHQLRSRPPAKRVLADESLDLRH